MALSGLDVEAALAAATGQAGAVQGAGGTAPSARRGQAGVQGEQLDQGQQGHGGQDGHLTLKRQANLVRCSGKRQQPHCPQMTPITRHQPYDLRR